MPRRKKRSREMKLENPAERSTSSQMCERFKVLRKVRSIRYVNIFKVRSLLFSFVKIAKPNRVKIYAYESSKLQRVFIKVVRWICQRLNGFFAKPSQILTKISQLVEAAASAVELV